MTIFGQVRPPLILCGLLIMGAAQPARGLDKPLTDFRRPTQEQDLRYWLENMVVYHRFQPDEIRAAIGLTPDESAALVNKYSLAEHKLPPRDPTTPLRVLPYPGGRHPRLGFLDGAVLPQRETKVSIFTPWDDGSYVVADVPEAIWSNLGLTYLAHTHIPTIWDSQGIVLPRLEWDRRAEGTLASERWLPNGIGFGAKVKPTPTEARLELWLRNGTPRGLTGLRIQNCVMLKAAAGFAGQTLTNKLFKPPFAAVHDVAGNRWIVTAWEACERSWGNAQVPCLHADPKFPECPPGETVRLHGWVSFYEGPNIESEFTRIERAKWLKP